MEPRILPRIVPESLPDEPIVFGDLGEPHDVVRAPRDVALLEFLLYPPRRGPFYLAGGRNLPPRAAASPPRERAPRLLLGREASDFGALERAWHGAPASPRDFASLPQRPIPPEAIAGVECPISLRLLTDLPKAAFWQRGELLVGADFDDLLTWLRNSPTDPCTRQSLTVEMLFRQA